MLLLMKMSILDDQGGDPINFSSIQMTYHPHQHSCEAGSVFVHNYSSILPSSCISTPLLTMSITHATLEMDIMLGSVTATIEIVFFHKTNYIIYRPYIFLDPKTFLVQKTLLNHQTFLAQKLFLAKKFFGLKLFWIQKLFL